MSWRDRHLHWIRCTGLGFNRKGLPAGSPKPNRSEFMMFDDAPRDDPAREVDLLQIDRVAGVFLIAT
jgi:hypothetical protein